MAYAYQADIWCDPCGRKIKRDLDAEDKTPEDTEDERTFDSDDYPKYADDDEQTDGPQHCAAGHTCEDAIDLPGHKVGAIIGSNLTREGIEYLIDMLNDPKPSRFQRALFGLWRENYGITYRVRFTAYNGISYDLDDRLSLDGARQCAADAINAARKEGRRVNVQEAGKAFEIEEREDAMSIDDASGFLRIACEVRA